MMDEKVILIPSQYEVMHMTSVPHVDSLMKNRRMGKAYILTSIFTSTERAVMSLQGDGSVQSISIPGHTGPPKA